MTCTCRDVEYAQLCTATPGALHYSADHVTLCPPDRDCVDVVVHRAKHTGWHTCRGTTVAEWYRDHASAPAQLALFGGAS